MALAMIYPEPAAVKRGSSSSKLEEAARIIPTGRLSEACAILRYSAGLADDILTGRRPFDDALKKAQAAATISKGQEAQLARPSVSNQLPPK